MVKPSPVNIHRDDPPAWFKQADFGIMIHWGLYSVPAFAPTNVPDYDTFIKSKPLKFFFANQPYAEWYANSILFPDSPAVQLYLQFLLHKFE